MTAGAVESGGAPSPLPYAAKKAQDMAPTPVEPGTQRTTASVSVAFSVS